ncbi:MAG TPA: membrane protein insertase YidC [Candidatus Acidoferrum sp.]|nr:membrane protein insertase YidC [Candidatus Acidoferrum sp.]
MSIFDIILNHPLGSMLAYTIKVLGSFGIGLIVFTFLTKVLLFPLSLITQRNTIKQMKVRPYEETIRKKYGADKVRYNQEISALYKEHGISASSGCLPLLVQMPILFALYKIIRMPLTYLLKLSAETITAVDTALGLGAIASGSATAEVTVAEALYSNFDKLVSQGIVPPTITPLNYEFLGMNLAAKPSLALNMMLLIPIFAGATAFLQSWYQAKTQPPAAAAAATSKSLMFTMPLLSVWITFSLPAGAGLYWGMSNLFMFLQTILLNKMMNPQKALKQAYVDMEEQQRNAKERKREAANQHRVNKETKNRAATAQKDGKGKTVTERIINDELDDYRPGSPTPQAKPSGKPTKGGYQRVLGYTSIPDPIDDDLAVEETEKSAGKLKKNRPKPGSGPSTKSKPDMADEAEETPDETLDETEDVILDDAADEAAGEDFSTDAASEEETL